MGENASTLIAVIAAIIGSGGINAILIKWFTMKSTKAVAAANAKIEEAKAVGSSVDSASKILNLVENSNEKYAAHAIEARDFYKDEYKKLQLKIEAQDSKHEEEVANFKKITDEYKEIKNNYSKVRSELTDQQLIINEILNNYCDEIDCKLRHPPLGQVNINNIKQKAKKDISKQKIVTPSIKLK